MLLVERNEGSIEDLRTNASHVSLLEDKLANYSSRIDQAEMSTDNATILSVMLMDINSSTTSSVEELRAQLDALNTPSQNISTIQSFIELLEQKLEMPRYDIPELYRDLHDMLANQELMRRNLEDSLQRLQEQVDYLEHVNSMLPQDCT